MAARHGARKRSAGALGGGSGMLPQDSKGREGKRGIRGTASSLGLRGSYTGYCPLASPENDGRPIGSNAAPPSDVERIPLAGLEPADFFERFVLARRPVILDVASSPDGPLAE
eukprot:CAMPEP_0183394172 /NCGR_PEP_ID=MMETSP0370-20130417/8388_1 /TAXON_ID=268820 /ORGANISM="Peridinium aciculiferum, Strain PAER-2" /LENGTH=112 /DNA_ID=CAMNT_0025574503 /DNA_START=51 /DNA_END=386 /DNA_ORIENTATION=+